VQEFAAAKVPFLFDPGQGLPLFSGAELIEMVDCADYLAVNDYEARLLAERTGLSLEAMAARVEALFVTQGGEGSRIYAEGKILDIAAVKPTSLVDPTGCGDAYRAGLLFGLQRGFDWHTTGRVAALLAGIKIEQHGTQQHQFSAAEFNDRFRADFGYAL
jgi:adenosine kinase